MSETRTLWPVAGRQTEQKQEPPLLGRIAIVHPGELQRRSQQDLIRRRLILDQARHRWLLAVKRQPAAQASGPSLARAHGGTQHMESLATLEPGFLWGLRRIGNGGHPLGSADHPLGAIPICRQHRWEMRPAGAGSRCAHCGLASRGSG